MAQAYQFKIAEFEWEFNLIFKLNYDTFVSEINQHHPNPQAQLIDKFHTENTYFIALEGKKLVGMVAVRDNRPFSLDGKLPDLDKYFPIETKKGEIRLLSIQKSKRGGLIAAELFKMIRDWAFEKSLDVLLISGIKNQIPLYSKLGFLPFGALVGSDPAWFQPMYLTVENFFNQAPSFISSSKGNTNTDRLSFLPGPTSQTKAIQEALSKLPISHRSLDYQLILKRIKWQISRLTKASQVEILNGTGTLANDVIAGQIKQLDAQGLILINGEFGERLVQHAKGFNLQFHEFREEFGVAFNWEHLKQQLNLNPNISWLWVVHLETSTGVINSLDQILQLTQPLNIKVCVDGVSSVGNIPTNYQSIYLASSVSGKGLCAYTGLSMVMYNHRLKSNSIQIPEYLNLYHYHQRDGVPFSGSSNLLRALYQSLESFDVHDRIVKIQHTFQKIHERLKDLDLPIRQIRGQSPILNIEFPLNMSSYTIGTALEKMGFYLHYKSRYLQDRNLIQIALMSENVLDHIDPMLQAFEYVCRKNLQQNRAKTETI